MSNALDSLLPNVKGKLFSNESNALDKKLTRMNIFFSFFKMENNKFFCFNLKLKAENLIACTSKEDLIELIRQSEDCQVEPIHSTLIEMARRKKIKNHTILTKYELRKALGLTTENKPRSKSYIFSKSPEESFEFATRKDAMDGMNVSSTKLARGIKDGKILIGNIEYKFERK